MPDWLTNLKTNNLEVVGEVDDAFEFIYSKAIEIVPLFSGSGIRIKIIEAMAAERAIISTSIGAEGINIENGKNILIADTPGDFFESIKKCVSNETFCRTLGQNARQLVVRDHSNQQLILKLEKFYRQIISR